MKKKVVCLMIIGMMVAVACSSSKRFEKENGKETNESLVSDKESDSVLETESENDKDSEADTENTTSVNEYEKIESDDKVIDKGGVVVVGDSGYEIYNYRDDTAGNYASAVTDLADALSGKANVYNMLIPLSTGIVFPDNLRDEINSSDEQKAINDIFSKMGDSVKKVNIYDSLMQHRKEYIYFRTDHHWTALGAYYAYEKFCEEKGITPEDINSYQKKEFPEFIGSFYNDTNEEALKANPDTVTAYVPNADAKMHVTPASGDEYDWDIINDVTNYKPAIKYSTFIASDNPFTEITNNELSDGSSCVVVKESFGNAFVPFLVDHYQKIYVVDYRYWNGNLKEFVEKNNVKDVLLLNNLSMIRNQYLIGQFQKVIEP